MQNRVLIIGERSEWYSLFRILIIISDPIALEKEDIRWRNILRYEAFFGKRSDSGIMPPSEIKCLIAKNRTEPVFSYKIAREIPHIVVIIQHNDLLPNCRVIVPDIVHHLIVIEVEAA